MGCTLVPYNRWGETTPHKCSCKWMLMLYVQNRTLRLDQKVLVEVWHFPNRIHECTSEFRGELLNIKKYASIYSTSLVPVKGSFEHFLKFITNTQWLDSVSWSGLKSIHFSKLCVTKHLHSCHIAAAISVWFFILLHCFTLHISWNSSVTCA